MSTVQHLLHAAGGITGHAGAVAVAVRPRLVLSKAVEWGKLLESLARNVKRLKVANRRTRILTDSEQTAIVEACPRKLRAIVALALLPEPESGNSSRSAGSTARMAT